MSDTFEKSADTGSTREEIGRDAARIASELTRYSGGTDPFAAAVRATRMPMIVTDPRQADNPVVFANNAFCRLTGYARDEIVGRNCRFLQGRETDPATVAQIRAAVEARRAIEIDIRNHRKDGQPFWNRLLVAPVYDAGGAITYFFASQVDVTLERERLAGLESHNAALMAEVAGRLHAQQESEARLRFATEAGRLGIWELELQTRQLTTSGICKDNFGRDRDMPFTYDDLEASIHADDLQRMRAAVDEAIATGSEYDIEYRILRPDGEIGWIQARAQVERTVDGMPFRMAGISLDVTNRRNAEARLELSEESLRLATEAAEIGTWDLDLTTDTLTWPDRTKAMFGISPHVPCSMADFYEGLHPDDRPETSIAFASAVDPAIRASYEVEYRTIGKEDGVVRWVAAKGRGLFDDGKCHRALGTAIDVTAKKRADFRQAFLLSLWDRLRGLTDPNAIQSTAVKALGRHLNADQVGYGIIQEDDETILLASSYARDVEPLAGKFPLSQFGDHNIDRQRRGLTVVYEDVADDPENDVAAWEAVNTRSFVSVPLVRADRLCATLYVANRRSTEWAAEDVALIQDVADRTWDAVERSLAEAALRAANDTLEQQVAERTSALQANEARMRAIFETNHQFQGLLTPDGTLLDTNVTSLDAIEARFEDVAGKPFWETPWFAATPGAPEAIRKAVATASEGETVRQEMLLLLPAGWRSFEFAIRPISDETGTVVGIVPEAIELTQRRQAEEALRQSQKMEAVGQLTGGMAHDFNNLLTGISGNLELLEARVAQGRITDLDRYLNAAQGAVRRAASLTHRLLAFSRRQTLDPRTTDINRLVADMVDLMRRTVGTNVEIEVVGAGGLWTTMADQNQLESALLNLCINARDAMPDGGRITIETANKWLDERVALKLELPRGQYVSLCVSDTGTGMTPDVIERAFDPFFTTKPIGQGTGLGLSMIYGFARQSGGQVRIYSEVGEGTTVCIYLPRHSGIVEEDEIAETIAQTPRTEQGETVLIVDDEATVRMLVTEVLEDLGYSAIEAKDGAGGLKLLQSDARIDLLITDVGLPGGTNGRQMADAGRVIRPNLKVLFITGYAENAVVGHGHLDAGMQLLTKPFTIETLGRRVKEMIDSH